MIFVANVLELNGGTTFLIRICEALNARGHHCAIVVLRRGGDAKLGAVLAQHAKIFALEDFQVDRARVFKRHFGTFAPLSWPRLKRALAPYGSTLHVMGAFGLIFAGRLARRQPSFRVTAGVYHQNEFVFRERSVFSRRILSLFRSLPPENVLFFNELVRDNYSRFHSIAYHERAPLTPIGIKIAPRQTDSARHRPGYEILSIGSLERFKTYNRHIIALLPQLRNAFPDVRYHIYGSGSCLDALRAQVDDLDVGGCVTFHGSLPYERFHDVVGAADVFVGSGTALVEAASVGRPALVGVESIEQPATYGFLSDIWGLAYNEAGAQPMRPMLSCLEDIFSDPGRWRVVAQACLVKAQDFSVERTAEMFMTLAASARPTPGLIPSFEVIRMLAELPALALWDRLSPEFAFAERRNQSFLR